MCQTGPAVPAGDRMPDRGDCFEGRSCPGDIRTRLVILNDPSEHGYNESGVTDVQILTICISMAVAFLAVFAGVLINNNRLNDVKELLRANLNDTRELLRAEIKAASAEAKADMADLRLLVEKQHSELLQKIADLENRRVLP